MSPRLLAAAGIVAAGCARAPQETPSSAAASASATPISSATSSATLSPSAAPFASVSVPLGVSDPEEERLQASTLVSLVPHRGPGTVRGTCDAVLQTAEGARPAIAAPALSAAPLAHRAPLAFYRLARALGMRVVPVATVRAVPIPELGAALGRDALGRVLLREARVQNDGTVDVLLSTRSSASTGSPWDGPRGLPFDLIEGPQAAIWDRWAGSPEPAPGENGPLLRDYLEVLVLDYLAANVARRTVMLSGTSALVLADNASAFPPHADHPLLDRMLRHLRVAARFPKGLRDALERFDRTVALRTFNAGSFEGWLLAPRTVVELDERRAALLTLIEARIAERGPAAVLSL